MPFHYVYPSFFFCSQETSKEKVKAISFSDLSRETEEGEETFQIKRSFFEECVRRETD